jgi:hypothetical protein
METAMTFYSDIDALRNAAQTDDAAAFITERAQAQHDARIARQESHDELVSRITREHLARKLEQLLPIDIMAGLESLIVSRDGAAVRAAWLKGPAAFGEYLMGVCRHEMELASEVEAIEAAEKIERPDGPEVH